MKVLNESQVSAIHACTHALSGARSREQELLAELEQLDASDPWRLRAQCDRRALICRYHNADLHHYSRPTQQEAAWLYDQVCLARALALGRQSFPGIAASQYRYWETQSGEREPLLRYAFVIFRSLSDGAVDAVSNPPIKIQQDLRILTPALGDESRFATLLGAMARAWSGLMPGGRATENAQLNRESATHAETEPSLTTEESEFPAHFDDRSASAEQSQHEVPNEGRGVAPPLSPPQSEYRIYTTAFDQEVMADGLLPASQRLRNLREHERQLVDLRALVTRLATKLKRRLLALQRHRWEFEQEEGLIDPTRLSRLITSPAELDLFKRERQGPWLDTVVTLLIDNSGSMRGERIANAALCADILIRTLERCGIRSELLGYTTRAWDGGPSARDWRRTEKPPTPGRLSPIRHIIYKSANQRWSRVRSNLGTMLQAEFLKENIDGEALLWAARRLLGRTEARRILLVISDGAPYDQATSEANGRDYLAQHLRHCIERLSRDSTIQLFAIGIGHNVYRYYPRAITLYRQEELGEVLIEELGKLLTEPRERPIRRPR